MPERRPKPRYLIVRASGDPEYDTVQEALTLAQKHQQTEPSASFYIVQKIATVTAHFTSKTVRHY